MKQDYIIFGAGHDGSVFCLTGDQPELPILPMPCVFNRSEKITPIELKIFDVVQMEYEGKKYNVASDTIISKEYLGRVIDQRRPNPIN